MSSPKDDALFSAHAVFAALRSSIRVLRWGMLALVVVYLFSGVTVIRPSDVGLILRLGKVLPQIHPPGLLFALPPPFDVVVTVPNKTVEEISLDEWAARPGELPNSTLHPVDDPYTLTGDANIIRAKFTARYQVADPISYMFAALNRDAIIRAILYNAAATTLAGMTVDDILTTRRDAVAEQTRLAAQTEIDRLGLGVQLIAFEIREIGPPAQVLPAFQNVVSARVEAKTLVEPANAFRASAIPEAESQAYQIAQEADSYAQQAQAKAEGEASSFHALATQYLASPTLVQARLYSEMLQAVLPHLRVSTVMPASQSKVRLLLSPQKADDSDAASDRQELNNPAPTPAPEQAAPQTSPEAEPPLPVVNDGSGNQPD